jgi:hypothetical protein
LYRQAAERFEAAGDLRHEEVVTHLRKFLALPLTASILDGSYKKPENKGDNVPKKNKDGVPEGEVLESHHSEELKDEKDSDKAFEENIDNLLKEAQEDFEKVSTNMEDSSTLETEASNEDVALADVAADLDAMMREADKELEELMKA